MNKIITMTLVLITVVALILAYKFVEANMNFQVSLEKNEEIKSQLSVVPYPMQ